MRGVSFVSGFVACLLVGTAQAGKPIESTKAKPDAIRPVLWYDIVELGIEGKGWATTKSPFDRLPAKAEGVVRPPVWSLSQNSAGLFVRFVTAASAIDARWTLTSTTLALNHMPATGVSGLDLYVKTPQGRWQWLGVGRPSAKTNLGTLVTGLPAGGKREFLLYLPLYNGVSSVEIGLPKDSSLEQADPWPVEKQKPIVFWGTSITQGGCASRPGMVHTSILNRRLQIPTVNLGFSGNGKMEPEVAQLVSEIDASIYVLDCLPNMSAKEVAERTAPVVEILRKARPTTPIMLVEDRTYANASVLPTVKQRNEESRAALKKVYESLQAAGVKGLHYLPGHTLLGEDGEDTVDSSHPTDLGFLRHADAFEKVLAPLLPKAKP